MLRSLYHSPEPFRLLNGDAGPFGCLLDRTVGPDYGFQYRIDCLVGRARLPFVRLPSQSPAVGALLTNVSSTPSARATFRTSVL